MSKNYIGIPIHESTRSEKVVAVALVDREDKEKVSKYHWCLNEGKNTDYARAYVKEQGKWKTIIMHRLIVDAAKGEVVHHINGNGLDNRKCNLQCCTRSQHSEIHDNLSKNHQ